MEARRDAALASRPQPGAPSQPDPAGDRSHSEKQVVCLPTEEITAALATGEAERLGILPGAPVLLRNRFWLADGARYIRVDDDLDQQLRRDHHRLKAADASIDAAPPDEQPP